MVEVKWRDKTASEMRGEDGEPPRVGLAGFALQLAQPTA
jgi:hypothetical protein